MLTNSRRTDRQTHILKQQTVVINELMRMLSSYKVKHQFSESNKYQTIVYGPLVSHLYTSAEICCRAWTNCGRSLGDSGYMLAQ